MSDMNDYRQVVSPDTPLLVVIAIDQSGSMNEAFTHCSMILSKSEVASMIASSIIEELVARSYHTDKSRHYFDLSVLGYSRCDVYPLLCNSCHPVPAVIFENSRPELIRRTIEYITPDNHLRLVPEAYYEWIKPKAAGPTAMLEMLDSVYDIVSDWCECRQNHRSFPPIVINITDGLDDLEFTNLHYQKSNRIKELGTDDGKMVFINVCIDSCPREERLYFPSEKDIKPSHNAAMLARMSSRLPALFNPLHKYHNGKVVSNPPYVAVCYNEAVLDIIPMLNMAVKLPEDKK